MTRIILFILCSFFLVRVSWRALGHPGAHGFYRFFVFEGILLLILLNQPCWFSEPFSVQHLVAWFLLILSVFFVIQSLLTLKRRGGHAERQEMPTNHAFENTAQVVETGLFHYIRHPMYSSLLFLGWGAFLKHITPLNVGLIIVVNIFLLATAKIEERENVRFFGTAYMEYMHRTRMFIPFIL